MPERPSPIVQLDAAQLRETSERTIGHYQRGAQSFWQGTRDHDVRQNVEALLRHLPKTAPLAILDFGCGPGRDLATFSALGHEAIGLDGTESFVDMARAHTGCQVLHQDFLALDLPAARFDGIFANASLFHVPSQMLAQVLLQLHGSLKVGGVLFCSNPHGPNHEGWSGDRYSAFLRLDTFRAYLVEAGFVELEHYYRPAGRPRDQQPWLASVWRKASGSTLE